MLVTLIISDVIYVIGGCNIAWSRIFDGYNSEGVAVNTLQSFDMTTQKWTNLPPMEEKRHSHAVCLQGERIIVAGGHNGSEFLDTCEAFDTKSKRLVLPHLLQCFPPLSKECAVIIYLKHFPPFVASRLVCQSCPVPTP